MLAGLAPTAGVFLFARVLQGMGGAMVFGTSVAILTSVFPPHRRGWVLGINVAATYSGLSMGPFIGGLLTQSFGWRSVFLINVPLGLLVLAALWLKMHQEWAECRGEPFDWKGSLGYSLMLTAFMLGFTWLPGRRGAAMLIIAAAAFAAVLPPGIAGSAPDFPSRGWPAHNTVFAFSNLAALVNYSATFAISFLLSLYLQYIKGFTPRTAGLVLIAQPVVMALFSPLAGRLSDRLEPRVVASLGMGLCAAGLFAFAWLGQTSGLGFIVVALVLVGFGFALFSSPNTNAIMGSVAKKILWRGRLNPGHHAHCRADAEHGHCHPGFFHVHRQGADHPGRLSAFSHRHEGFFWHFFCFVLLRYILFPGPRPDALIFSPCKLFPDWTYFSLFFIRC